MYSPTWRHAAHANFCLPEVDVNLDMATQHPGRGRGSGVAVHDLSYFGMGRQPEHFGLRIEQLETGNIFEVAPIVTGQRRV